MLILLDCIVATLTLCMSRIWPFHSPRIACSQATKHAHHDLLCGFVDETAFGSRHCRCLENFDDAYRRP